MVLSHYVTDSWLIGIFQSGFLNGLVSNEHIPSLPVNLTTTYFQGLLPGLVERYGKDQNVSIILNATVAPTTIFHADGMGVMFSTNLTFYVHEERAITVTVTNMDFIISLALNSNLLKVQIVELKDFDCQASNSVIGDFNAAEFKDFFNVGARVAIPFINTFYLYKGFALPTDFFGVLRITDATFEQHENYLKASIRDRKSVV